MNFTKKFKARELKIFPALLILLALSGAACATRRPAATWAEKNIHSIAIFPPQTSVWLQELGKREYSPERARAAQAELLDLVAAEMRRRGFVLPDTKLDERDPADPEQQSPYFSWARTMVTAYNSLQVPDTAGGIVPIGHNQTDAPLMKRLARHTGSDALVMTRAFGFRRSSGNASAVAAVNTLQVLAALSGGPALFVRGHAAGVRIYLVDGQSGEILWTGVAFEGDLEKPHLEKMVSKIFQDFPP